MIIGWFLQIVYAFVSSLIGLLPVGTLGIPSGFTDGLALIVSYLHSFSWLLPVDQLLAAAIFVVGFYAILLLVKILRWIIHLVRGN